MANSSSAPTSGPMDLDGIPPARDLRPVPRHEWIQILRRARLGDLVPPSSRTGKNGHPTRGGVAGSTVMAVALTFASYGDETGADVFPGDATIAHDVEVSLDTVTRVRKALLRVGLLQQVAGRRRHRPGEEYRLTLPVDLLELLDVASPAQQKIAAKRIRDKARGTSPGARSGVPSDPPSQLSLPVDNLPVDNSSGGPTDPPSADLPESVGGSVGPPEISVGGSDGGPSGGPSEGRTRLTTPPITTTPPATTTVDLDVTASRAQADENFSHSTDQPPPVRARGVARVPTQKPPTKCDHGQPLAKRADGTPRCTHCWRKATINEPTGQLAQIIPFPHQSPGMPHALP